MTRWAVLVILSALNPKIQIGMIQKFASLARACAEERNFSTAMQIFSALCDQQIIQLEVSCLYFSMIGSLFISRLTDTDLFFLYSISSPSSVKVSHVMQ